MVLNDLGEGIPFRAGAFDGAISIREFTEHSPFLRNRLIGSSNVIFCVLGIYRYLLGCESMPKEKIRQKIQCFGSGSSRGR